MSTKKKIYGSLRNKCDVENQTQPCLYTALMSLLVLYCVNVHVKSHVDIKLIKDIIK